MGLLNNLASYFMSDTSVPQAEGSEPQANAEAAPRTWGDTFYHYGTRALGAAGSVLALYAIHRSAQYAYNNYNRTMTPQEFQTFMNYSDDQMKALEGASFKALSECIQMMMSLFFPRAFGFLKKTNELFEFFKDSASQESVNTENLKTKCMEWLPPEVQLMQRLFGAMSPESKEIFKNLNDKQFSVFSAAVKARPDVFSALLEGPKDVVADNIADHLDQLLEQYPAQNQNRDARP